MVSVRRRHQCDKSNRVIALLLTSSRIYVNFQRIVADSSTQTPARTLLHQSLQEHLAAIRDLIDAQLDQIEQGSALICETLERGNKILLCGNGGSAADAQHIAAELVGRYERNRKSFPAISLTTDTSALTALSNDYGFDEVFARQIEGLAVAGDLLIAISTSGRSPNIINAVEQARKQKCKVLGLTGCSGEPLASHCDLAVIVPSNRTARVQEAHITIGHLWCEVVDHILGDRSS